MRANQISSRRYTQPSVTVDQAREMVWLRAAFPEGFAVAAAQFLRTCDADAAAALMCTVQVGRAGMRASHDQDWLALLFTEATILMAQNLRKNGDRFHRLMYLFGQVDQTGRIGLDTDHQVDSEDVFGVDDATEIKMFVGGLYQKTTSYRAHILTRVCGTMANKTLGATVRLV